MTILIACDTLPEGTFNRDKIPAIRGALCDKDYKIIDLFDFTNRAHEIRRGNIKAFFQEDLKEMNRLFLQNIFSHQPKLLVLGTLDPVSLFVFPETLEMLRRHMPVVCLFGDDEFMLNRHAHWVGRFDKNVVYVKWCADYYNNIIPNSTYYLPWGCYFEERDFDKLQCEPEYDAIFIGSAFGKRPELLERIDSSFRFRGGIKLAVYGNGWEDHYRMGPYRKGFLGPDKINQEIRKSKMVLALLEDHLTGACHMNASPWLAIKNGRTPICTQYSVLEDYDLEFTTYCPDGGFPTLAERVSFCLQYPAAFKEGTRRLFEEAKEKYDFTNLFREMFEYFEREF